MSTITIEIMQEAIDLVYPPLYYGLDKHVERGTLYLCKETNWNPEYIVCHPDDFEQVKKAITNRRLVHIKDEPKKSVCDRLIKRLGEIRPVFVNYLS